MRVVYRKKRDGLIAAISTYFPDSVEVIGLNSGLHFLMQPNNGMSEQELIESAAKYSIKVYPVSEYGQNNNQTVLLGFAVLSEKEIHTAIQLLAKAWMG
jgi:GntR family transcriptional regulator / MocR family aminotransferase